MYSTNVICRMLMLGTYSIQNANEESKENRLKINVPTYYDERNDFAYIMWWDPIR